MVLRRKIKILELTNYSAGICGVWQRVMQESKELAEKGYVVRVFSSNTTKASSKLACNEEKIGNIPDPCKVPVFNIKTHELKVLDFSSVADEEKVVDNIKIEVASTG